jgi:hypothetical protein
VVDDQTSAATRADRRLGVKQRYTFWHPTDGSIHLAAVLIQAAVVEWPLFQNLTEAERQSNLALLTRSTIKETKKNPARLVNTYRQDNLFLNNPARIAGFFIVLTNFKALCGREKL